MKYKVPLHGAKLSGALGSRSRVSDQLGVGSSPSRGTYCVLEQYTLPYCVPVLISCVYCSVHFTLEGYSIIFIPFFEVRDLQFVPLIENSIC